MMKFMNVSQEENKWVNSSDWFLTEKTYIISFEINVHISWRLKRSARRENSIVDERSRKCDSMV